MCANSCMLRDCSQALPPEDICLPEPRMAKSQFPGLQTISAVFSTKVNAVRYAIAVILNA
jgi:hypothetical protein